MGWGGEGRGQSWILGPVESEFHLHVNLLETLAVVLAFQASQQSLQQGVILVQTDGTTILLYLNRPTWFSTS